MAITSPISLWFQQGVMLGIKLASQGAGQSLDPGPPGLRPGPARSEDLAL
eukprot:NODE_2309_length_1152_cov_4.012693_g1916_i0.p3 GENE.NODE_2309_length_1152_cov_4.012693_g1916_i0~~NODE_2309_length_1152_cov_4.012693_g1916_i0.p3  ORF type:complete len:50 (-),score=2.78 NODE_2309_length_1152_cov_4.012693_g1916_i0:153-302(-)